MELKEGSSQVRSSTELLTLSFVASKSGTFFHALNLKKRYAIFQPLVNKFFDNLFPVRDNFNDILSP